MPSRPLGVVVRHLRAAAGRDGDGWTDGELLTSFLSRRDEDALAALVERHAPMVWGVCRRILRNSPDAEDAFQATFLVLVQKAATVVPREMVANWLYGVAQQTAVRLRATAAKRGWREVQMNQMPEPPVAEARDEELLSMLDEELSRLPERFRALIVLCDLEGHTRKEVARQLGCPEGTVASGLARARELLAKRLTQRGLAVSGGSLAALSHSVASAEVPVSVVTSTINVATLLAAGKAVGVISGPVATLTQGVLKAMFLKKIMTPAVVLALSVAVLTGGSLAVGQTEGKPIVGKDTKPLVAEKSVEPAVKQEKEAFTAWGKEVGGVQAGLGYKADEKRTYHTGETVALVLRVRNVGKEEVKFSYYHEEFYERPPVVTDDEGKPVPLEGAILLGLALPVDVTLAPGKEVDLSEASLVLRPASEKGNERPVWKLFGTGKFQLQCDKAGGSIQDEKIGPDPILSKLATGKLELEVKDLEKDDTTAWGKEVNGVQVGIRLGEHRVYQVGETVSLTVRLRNNGKEPVPFRGDAEYFQKNPPLITDADGKAVAIRERSVWGFILQKSVAPGKEVDLIQLELALRPVAEREKNAAWTLYGTGKFQIQYLIAGVVGEAQLGSPGLTLTTGKLTLEVTDKPPADEKKAGDVPAKPKPEAKKAYTPEELMREKYDAVAIRTVSFKVVTVAKPTEVKQSPDKDATWVIGHSPNDVSLLPQPPKKFHEEQFSVILTAKVVDQLKRIGVKDVGKHFDGKTICVSGRIQQRRYISDDPPEEPHSDLVIEDLSQIEAVE